MKKNAMLKIAAILMVAVLLTTCAISSTFAKYTTTSAASTVTASVAKWGVTITTDVTGLFDDTYAKDDTTFTIADNTVVAAQNAVAPGTTGSMETVTVATGTPEVAVRFTTDATLSLEGWGDICPVVFNVNGTDYAQIKDNPETTDVDETEDVATFAGRVVAAIEAITVDYAANTNLAQQDQITGFDISWSWAFDGDDAVDTALGNAAAAGSAASITLTLQQTLTQIN